MIRAPESGQCITSFATNLKVNYAESGTCDSLRSVARVSSDLRNDFLC